MTPSRRRSLVALAIALVLLLVAGPYLAAWQLQTRIEAALGPRATLGDISIGWSGSVELRQLRIQAAPGWPAEDELRAERVHIRPDLRSLLGGPWRIASVTVEGGYLSAQRSRDGRLRLLPALLEERAGRAQAPSQDPIPAPAIEIDEIRIADGALAFFDHSVRRPALQLRIEQLAARLGPLRLPALDQALQIELGGVFKGPQRDGRIEIQGRYTPSSHDADLRARFSDVDLLALQPYLLKVAEAGVRRGTLDLDVHATVVGERLRAPGTLTLTNLELASGGGPLATFAGVPRQAVLAAMTRDGRLQVRFTLEGRLDDPAFSLNENLATKLASGLAETLGVSVSGVVKGLGGLVKGLFGR
ncbi:DUF748 domain-containing protein [Paucibacter sp. M5-1]|uniref:DUF748 domain-containing protein n=1 Tax=Paucibacter sp. M5-1 TaxID=3015998 RepID=UPI0022B91B25|nr:DUF748 domain-containing protein [Paucibacter sp. M5-1]MCZ7881380.1 DUF748 domain-containing protein [Paucibacter sp. M5-1]